MRKAVEISFTLLVKEGELEEISDISPYWVEERQIGVFVPEDFHPDADDITFLKHQNKFLKRLLGMKFHIFWSNMIYNQSIIKCIHSFLQFSPRPHDWLAEEEKMDTLLTQKDIYKNMFWVLFFQKLFLLLISSAFPFRVTRDPPTWW